MNFDLSDEQFALQDVLARFAADRFPTSESRRWGAAGGFDRDRWAQLASLGVFALAPADGTGSLVDAALAFEVLGRTLVPGPVVAAALSAGLLDGADAGSVVPTLVDRRAPTMLAPHLADADVVVALADDGVWAVDRDAVSAVEVESLDPTATVWIVEHLPDGSRIGDADAAARARDAGALLVSALLLGVGAGATDRAVEHAKDRWQFGRPIGSFQAIKHLLADCYTRTEVARAALYAAAVHADDPATGDPARAAAGARYLATEAATRNAATSLQVFGGMGFTWEVDAHLYVKRAWALRSALGSVDAALDAIALQMA